MTSSHRRNSGQDEAEKTTIPVDDMQLCQGQEPLPDSISINNSLFLV